MSAEGPFPNGWICEALFGGLARLPQDSFRRGREVGWYAFEKQLHILQDALGGPVQAQGPHFSLGNIAAGERELLAVADVVLGGHHLAAGIFDGGLDQLRTAATLMPWR